MRDVDLTVPQAVGINGGYALNIFSTQGTLDPLGGDFFIQLFCSY